MWKYINPGLANMCNMVHSFNEDLSGTSWNGIEFSKKDGFGIKGGKSIIELPDNTKNVYMKFDIACGARNTDLACNVVIEFITDTGKTFKITGTGQVFFNVTTPFGSVTSSNSINGITGAYFTIEQIDNTVKLRYYWNGSLSIEETYENTLGDFNFTSVNIIGCSFYEYVAYYKVSGVITNVIISDTEIPLSEQVIAIPVNSNSSFPQENGNYSIETSNTVTLTPNQEGIEQLNIEKHSEITGLCTVARKLYRDGEGLNFVSSAVNNTKTSKKDIPVSDKIKYYSCIADKVKLEDFVNYEIGLKIE